MFSQNQKSIAILQVPLQIPAEECTGFLPPAIVEQDFFRGITAIQRHNTARDTDRKKVLAGLSLRCHVVSHHRVCS